jgi:hypothetical protein
MTWEHEVDYARLVSVPEIQRLVARHASLAAKRVSAETFLRLASDISHLGIPLDTVGLVGRDLWERLGVKTGKERQAVIPKSTGKVIVSALCSLAHNGQPLKQVRQFADGCNAAAYAAFRIGVVHGTRRSQRQQLVIEEGPCFRHGHDREPCASPVHGPIAFKIIPRSRMGGLLALRQTPLLSRVAGRQQSYSAKTGRYGSRQRGEAAAVVAWLLKRGRV